MNTSAAIKYFCLLFSMLVVLATVASAPAYADYDNNLHDLFEMLLQRDELENRLGAHQVVRKSRGPQLRLRFGKRPDAEYGPIAVERPPSLRLRFGKRSEDSPVSAFMTGITSDAEN